MNRIHEVRGSIPLVSANKISKFLICSVVPNRGGTEIGDALGICQRGGEAIDPNSVGFCILRCDQQPRQAVLSAAAVG